MYNEYLFDAEPVQDGCLQNLKEKHRWWYYVIMVSLSGVNWHTINYIVLILFFVLISKKGNKQVLGYDRWQYYIIMVSRINWHRINYIIPVIQIFFQSKEIDYCYDNMTSECTIVTLVYFMIIWHGKSHCNFECAF